MAAVPVAHEHMHQGAGQHQQKRQGPYDVRQKLRQQEVGRDCADDHQTYGVARPLEAGRCSMVIKFFSRLGL